MSTWWVRTKVWSHINHTLIPLSFDSPHAIEKAVCSFRLDEHFCIDARGKGPSAKNISKQSATDLVSNNTFCRCRFYTRVFFTAEKWKWPEMSHTRHRKFQKRNHYIEFVEVDYFWHLVLGDSCTDLPCWRYRSQDENQFSFSQISYSNRTGPADYKEFIDGCFTDFLFIRRGLQEQRLQLSESAKCLWKQNWSLTYHKQNTIFSLPCVMLFCAWVSSLQAPKLAAMQSNTTVYVNETPCNGKGSQKLSNLQRPKPQGTL